MSIKLVLFPLSVVIAIASGIFWIYPEYQNIVNKQTGKQVLLQQEQEKLRQIEERSANVSALKANMESNSTSVEAVFDYLPTTSEEEDIVNSLEKLVQDSGAALVGIDVVAADTAKKSSVRSGAAAMEGDAEGMSGEYAVSSLEKEPVSFKLSVGGSYEAIRAFVGNIERFFRDTNVKTLSIGKNTDSDTLSASIDVDFDYAPITKLGELQPSPVFERSAYDFSVIDQYRALFSRPYMAASVDRPSGRINPFVP